MQRDFKKILTLCQQRGHDTTVFFGSWEGECLPNVTEYRLPLRGLTNHQRALNFARDFAPHSTRYDGVIGFNRMPHLDIYYAADPCFASQSQSLLYQCTRQWTARYRIYRDLEKSVYDVDQKTHILLLSEELQRTFQYYYETQSERFHRLPPGIDARFKTSLAIADQTRKASRHCFGLSDHEQVTLFIGSAFKTKGLDRALYAFAKLPASLQDHHHLWVLGSDKPDRFLKLAKRLNVAHRLKFWGGQVDVRPHLQAADLLLHPARRENTGTVLLEAMISGLPALASGVCGYSKHIKRANGGVVLPEPFSQKKLNDALAHMLTVLQTTQWRSNGIKYGCQHDLYSCGEHAVDVIEQVITDKMRDSTQSTIRIKY